MDEFPDKHFVVIGPFDHVNDKLQLQEVIQTAVMDHNKIQILGRLNLKERC
jgi:hypothetical protein